MGGQDCALAHRLEADLVASGQHRPEHHASALCHLTRQPACLRAPTLGLPFSTYGSFWAQQARPLFPIRSRTWLQQLAPLLSSSRSAGTGCRFSQQKKRFQLTSLPSYRSPLPLQRNLVSALPPFTPSSHGLSIIRLCPPSASKTALLPMSPVTLSCY